MILGTNSNYLPTGPYNGDKILFLERRTEFLFIIYTNISLQAVNPASSY
jgi:hypothetical protein